MIEQEFKMISYRIRTYVFSGAVLSSESGGSRSVGGGGVVDGQAVLQGHVLHLQTQLHLKRRGRLRYAHLRVVVHLTFSSVTLPW